MRLAGGAAIGLRNAALCTMARSGSYVGPEMLMRPGPEGPSPCPTLVKLGFAPFAQLRGVLVVFCAENLKFGPATQQALAPIGDHLRRAAAADRFTGKSGSSLDIIAPAGLNLPRLVVVGTGKQSEAQASRYRQARRRRHGKGAGLPRRGDDLRRVRDRGAQGRPDRRSGARRAAARLRVRSLQDQAQGRRGAGRQASRSSFACANPAAAEKAWARTTAIADGVVLARDLVNEPAERALSRRIRPPRLGAEASSASASRCSTWRR